MSTRGNVIVKASEKGAIYVNIYNHSDSYPTGLGVDLAAFVKNRTLVNGIGVWDKPEIRRSNGVGDLAAQMVALLKPSADDLGGVYLSIPKSPLRDPNDYTYTIYPVTETVHHQGWEGQKPFDYENPTGGLMVTVHHWKRRVFKGTADEFAVWIDKEIEKERVRMEKLERERRAMLQRGVTSR